MALNIQEETDVENAEPHSPKPKEATLAEQLAIKALQDIAEGQCCGTEVCSEDDPSCDTCQAKAALKQIKQAQQDQPRVQEELQQVKVLASRIHEVKQAIAKSVDAKLAEFAKNKTQLEKVVDTQVHQALQKRIHERIGVDQWGGTNYNSKVQKVIDEQIEHQVAPLVSDLIAQELKGYIRKNLALIKSQVAKRVAPCVKELIDRQAGEIITANFLENLACLTKKEDQGWGCDSVENLISAAITGKKKR